MRLILGIVQSSLMMVVAVLLVLVAWRRREWRGGLLAMAFVFLGVAFNELDIWQRYLPMVTMDEPEIIPIIIALICAAVCIVRWRGSTQAAFF